MVAWLWVGFGMVNAVMNRLLNLKVATDSKRIAAK